MPQKILYSTCPSRFSILLIIPKHVESEVVLIRWPEFVVAIMRAECLFFTRLYHQAKISAVNELRFLQPVHIERLVERNAGNLAQALSRVIFVIVRGRD